VISRLRTSLGQPGAFHVPEDITEDYCKQLVSEARVIVEGRPTWIKRSRHNHYLDCEALCAAIGYALNVQRIPEGVTRPSPQIEAATGNAEPPLPLLAARESPLRQRFALMGQRLNR
jgi:hypothetical protein